MASKTDGRKITLDGVDCQVGDEIFIVTQTDLNNSSCLLEVKKLTVPFVVCKTQKEAKAIIKLAGALRDAM